MKRQHYWPYLIPLISSMILSAGYLALAQGSLVQTQEHLSDAQSATSITGQIKGTPGVAIKSAVVNVRELAARQALTPAPYKEPKLIREPGPGPRNRPVPGNVVIQRESPSPDAFGESNAPSVASPVPASSFKALEDDNTVIPPDTSGAVGPSHLMIAHNTQIRFQTKTGTTLNTISLDGFWAPLDNPNAFDPKVLYDKFNNRWILVCAANPFARETSSILIGISQDGDPTGTWRIWKVAADRYKTYWADYPSVGFNKNWIVVTVNMFAFDSFVYEAILAFDKTKIYAPSPTATFTRFEDSRGFSGSPAVTYDNTQNTLYLVEDWSGNSEGNGFLRISTITGTASAPVLTKGTSFPSTSNPWGLQPPDTNFAPQLGSGKKIQNNDSRIVSSVYRNGSLWCAHTIFLPATGPTHSAVQWWELTPTGTVKQRARIEDATAPLTFYAFPSIAVNKNNDVLIGYSRFSSQQYASANYSFRAGTDPVNTLRAERVLKAGSAPYYKTFGGTRNRWGDYSSTVVDPVNDLDMWTLQEHAAPVSGGFSRWGTWWGRIGPSTPAPLMQLGTVTATDGGTDPDTVIEPGESDDKLTIQLKNTGNGAATAMSAKLTTSTAGVRITTNTSAYPNLDARTGAGNNATPFTFNVASSLPCGQPLSFKLTVTYTGGGSPATLIFTIPTGRPGAAVTKDYTGPVKAIPDDQASGVDIPLEVSGFTGKIFDLNFKIGGTKCTTNTGSITVGIDHPWVGDLVIKLKSPQGTTITLINRVGGGDYGSSGNNFCNTLLDDDASTRPSIQSIAEDGTGAPYTGSFRPANPLSAFDGQNPNGTWTVNVSDRGAGYTGNVQRFSLIIMAYACSTTALNAPVELQSDRALAGLPGSQLPVTPSQLEAGFEQTPQLFDSASQIADIASLTATQQGSLAKESYLEALFSNVRATPCRIEGELLQSAFTLQRYDYLIRLLAE